MDRTRIPLRELYQEIKLTLPHLEHDEKEYVENIISAFKRNERGNEEIISGLEKSGLDWNIPRNFPKAVIYGSKNYLVKRGVSPEHALGYMNERKRSPITFQ